MRKFIKISSTVWIFLLYISCTGQETKVPSLVKFSDGIHHWNLTHEHRNYSRYDSADYVSIATNFIKYQNSDGGWAKNIDWLAKTNPNSVLITIDELHKTSTLDNNNTYPQIEYLAKVYKLTNNIKYKESAEKGIDYLLNSQNKSGGWRGWDTDAITYNDQIMSGVMNFFLDIEENNDIYGWISTEQKANIKTAFEKAISVTLQCQIKVNGVKTAWCQQHDHETLEPVKARSYELPSITARESTDVIDFLMRIKHPNDSIKNAINSSIMWLKKSAIHGIRLERIHIADSQIINQEYPYDLIVVNDSLAKPIWARYYDIETNKPFLCKRNGTIVYQLSEVDPERRTGYAWYGYWPEATFAKYKEWLKTNDVK